MTRQSKEEYLLKMRARYARAGRAGRSKLLDECEEVCGYDRKYLIRLSARFDYDLNRTLDEIRPGYSFDVTCQGTVPEAIILK
jgi:hypothetical protein